MLRLLNFKLILNVVMLYLDSHIMYFFKMRNQDIVYHHCEILANILKFFRMILAARFPPVSFLTQNHACLIKTGKMLVFFCYGPIMDITFVSLLLSIIAVIRFVKRW